MYLKVQYNNSIKNYNLTNNYNKPYIKISNSILPLTTNTTNGIHLNIQANNTTYRPLEYNSMSTSNTYYTNKVDSIGLSSTTALTRSSIYDTQYYTRSSTSSTVYYTRSSISGTNYLTITNTNVLVTWNNTAYTSVNTTQGLKYWNSYRNYTLSTMSRNTTLYRSTGTWISAPYEGVSYTHGAIFFVNSPTNNGILAGYYTRSFTYYNTTNNTSSDSGSLFWNSGYGTVNQIYITIPYKNTSSLLPMFMTATNLSFSFSSSTYDSYYPYAGHIYIQPFILFRTQLKLLVHNILLEVVHLLHHT